MDYAKAKAQDMARVFYDAEFTGLHRNTTLVSIGMVTDYGSHFYAEFTDFDESQVDSWLRENVIKNLRFCGKEDYVVKEAIGGFSDKLRYRYNCFVSGKPELVKEKLLEWLWNEANVSEKQIQFYTDCYAYDWVLLNDLICEDGKALNLPSYLYYIPMDLSTYLQVAKVDPDITREEFVKVDEKPESSNEPLWQFPSFNRERSGEEQLKHNSLWDAIVARKCFVKLDNCMQLYNF